MENKINISNQFPVNLKRQLDITMVGQNKYKEKTAMAIYKHIKYGIRDPFLVIGPSGSGKTYLMQQLKKYDLLPKDYSVMVYDYSRQTPAGIAGDDISDMLESWRDLCDKDKNTKKRGIIFLDEIDKIIMPMSTINHENMNATVQFQLMNALQGTYMEGVDTNNILFVLGGAFVELDKYRAEKNNKKRTIGFTTGEEESSIVRDDIREDLINIGAQREFVGRIKGIVQLESLNRRELKALLLHPTNGVIAKKKYEFQREGLTLTIDCDVEKYLIDSVIKEGLGARSLNNVLDRVLDDCDFHALEKGYTHIHIDLNAIKNGTPLYSKEEINSSSGLKK